MRIAGLLSRDDAAQIHGSALRVLGDVGVRVEHAELRRRLQDVGGRSSDGSDTVRFDETEVEKRIAAAPKHPMEETARPVLSAHVGVYQCAYLPPGGGEPVAFDDGTLATYLGLAKKLTHVEHISILGVPFVPSGMTPRAAPLAEKLYAWKHGVGFDGTVQFTELCEPILEMLRIHAAASGSELEDVFAACGHMVSPLRLARPECEQLLFFHEHGLRFGLGNLPSQGGTTPVTAAGALVQSLAERIFLFLLREAMWGGAQFELSGNVSTMDMRTGSFCYGRPEQQRLTLATADLARFYGCSCGGHTGLTDAKVPSYEAGAQKAYGMLYTALAVGHASVSAGLMSVDELCSPVQMVLDDELVGALSASLDPVKVDPERCAVDDIARSAESGGYLASPFTAEHFRDELWSPVTWSAESLATWRAGGGRNAVDRARDIVATFESEHVPSSCIDAEEERALREIIDRAAGDT